MRTAFLILALFLVAGCASNRNLPGNSGLIIDTQGVDMTSYNEDFQDCQAYADEVPVGERAASGAVAGAVVGGAIGAVLGDGRGAERGAGVGAISGGVRGAQSGLSERDQVLKNCMQGRGYRVLN